MADLDLFYAAADGSSASHTRTSGTTSGATTLNPEGSVFTLASAPSTPFAVGQRVFILSTDFTALAYCEVKKVASSTSLTLLPMQSASDGVTLPYEFPSGSAIVVLDEVAATQVIDLSEAPEDAYDFLLVGCGTVESSASPGDVAVSIRAGALQDDPYSGTANVGLCNVTLTAANPDRMNFFGATKISCLGGQRYENHLSFAGPNTGGVVTYLTNGRLLALRLTGGYFAGDGKTVEQTTTTQPAYTDYLDLGANLPAGQYLIACSWVLGANSGVAAEAILEADGSTVLANHVSTMPGASNYIPAGFMGFVTLGATNRVRLRFRSVGGATARIKNAFLAAVPVANIPGLAAAQVSQDLSTDVSASIGTTFTDVKVSGSVTLESGRHIEIISASLGGGAAFRARPNYGGAGPGLGQDNLPPFGTGSTSHHPTVWFIRNRRTAGATTSAVQMRSQSGTNTLRARDFTFSWLREQPDFRAQPDEPMAIVADIEMGGRVLKSWNATTTTRRYSHRISDYDMMSRVQVNGETYTRVYSSSDLGDGKWFWDATAHDIYVQLTATHAAIGTPASGGLHVVVVPLLLAGLEKHDLVDARGVRWPYRPLLKSVPSATQGLKSSNARFSSASSLGSLQLVMTHGEFDDKLFRSSFESYRAKVRRGFPRKSRRLEDWEVVADATIRRPQSNFETLTLRMLDRRRLLQTPVATTRVTVREGFGTDARSRENQEIDVVYGETLGLVAYRVTANEGGSDWNEYQFCDHAVPSVTAVWIDTERRKKIAGGNLNVTSTYIGVGKVRVNNAAFDEPTQPPDVVYVDLSAGRTADGTTTGKPLHTIGAIARDLIVTYGGTPAARLIEKSLRMIDRRWRWQQLSSGAGRRPQAPRLSLVISGKTNVEQALSQLCGDGFASWLVNHQDRVGVDVPDFDRGLMTRNSGFEDDTTSTYPWSAKSGATISITTARKFGGLQSAEVSNGSPTNANAHAAQNVLIAAGDTHAVTLVASLLEGVADSFRIGIVGPSGVETLSEAMTLETGRWTRHSLVYESEPGDSGFTELRIYPAHGSTTATRVAIDNVEMYRIACVTDRVRSFPQDVDWEDEHYYECTVPYGVNRQKTDQISKRKVGESEARGLSAALQPEGKFAIASSTLAELDQTRAATSESAGGIAAAVALQYSRQRPVLAIEVYGLERIPVVGDYVFHRLNPRIPESADEYPIWRVAEVGFGERGPEGIELKLRRQIDPITDRVDISPDNVPMGASAPNLSPASITDYAEVTALQNQYLAGARKPDTSTQRGDLTHKHSLEHTHAIPSHDHDVTPTAHGIDAEGAAGQPWPVKYDGLYGYPAPVGPQEPENVSRGLTDGGHEHGIPGPNTSGAASGTSSPPNATLETAPGPNDPSYRLVRIMQRIANTVDTIDANLLVGFLTLPLPAGWTRRTELDGLYLRCAGTLGPLSTTTTATFTPSDAGSTLALTSGTGAILGRRLTVTKSGSTVHVIITVENGANPTVVPLHETGDVANGSFPSGSGATVTADSQLLVRTNVATSTYTPNDAGSTLTVASATNISVGSLLTVVNTDDANKYVHVRVTAVSGVNLTVVPLHLPGDQANSYSFAAGAGKLVIHSEFTAPTHKHGGTMASHQHTGGGHQHPAASFVLGGASNGFQAQKYLGFGTSEDLGDAADDDHTHVASITPPGDNTNSSSAAGTITGELAPVLPFYEVIWASSDGTQKTIPASGILLWTVSDDPPGGWKRLGAAKDLFLKGAAAGAAATSGTGGHVHQQADDAHTLTHSHGGTAIQPSNAPDGETHIVEQKAGAATKSVAAGRTSAGGGHAHQVTATIESVNPGLSANTAHATGAALLGLPRHKTVMLIQKS